MANASFSPARENTVDNKLDLKIDHPPGGHSTGELVEAQRSPILVLSRYSALIETVRKATSRGVPVVQAPDVDQAIAKMRSVRPGVLVVDTASTSDLAAMVVELTAFFPTMVIVAAGQRDDADTLMQLTASGQIFRFLLVPLSHGQTRLTLEAALAEHKKLITTAPRMDEHRAAEQGAKKSDVAGYAALAVGLALSVGGIWWFASRTVSEPEAPVVATAATTSTPTITIVSRTDPLQAALALAQGAFARGEYIEPAGQSALDYYRSALRMDPTSRSAQEGIRSIANEMLERAGSALNAQRVEDAVTAIETARGIDPQHPRLASLDALVAIERAKLSQEQDKSRRVEVSNLDEARSLVRSARALDSDGASLAAVERVQPDPRSNAVANQQPRPVAPATTPPAPAPVASLTNDAGKERVADTSRAASEGKLIDPKTDDAKDAAGMLRATGPAPAESNALASSPSAPGNDAAITQAEREVTAARTNTNKTGEASNIVAAATLRRIRTVEPVYPIAARRRKEQGMVEVVFTVTPDGGVENVEVRQSTPELVFDEAAKQAVEQWRFEPVKVNGESVSQRAFARLRFSLD